MYGRQGPTEEECREALLVMLETHGHKAVMEWIVDGMTQLRRESEARGD